MRIYNWLALLVLGMTSSCNLLSGNEKITRLDPDAFESALLSEQDALILDVRTPEEYRQGYIEKAGLLNIYDADFREKVKALPKDKHIYVYCRSSARSMQAAKILAEEGIETIFELRGGMNAWYRSGKKTKT